MSRRNTTAPDPLVATRDRARRGTWYAYVVAAALAIALPAAIYAAREGTSGVTADVCIKPNGQLRVVTPNQPCRPPETAEQWTVGGVKDLRAGDGLVAQNDDGVVALEVDPGLIESANAAKIFAGFDDEGDIPGAPGAPLSQIGTLDLPAGAYAIWAKLTVTTEEEASWSVRCRLQAGADFDESRVELFVNSSLFRGRAIPMALEVVHRFTDPGEVEVRCGSVVGADFEFLKIVAVRATSVSNMFIG